MMSFPAPIESSLEITPTTMQHKFVVMAKSQRPGVKGDVPTEVRVHSPLSGAKTKFPGSHAATGNTLNISQSSEGHPPIKMEAGGTWHPWTKNTPSKIKNDVHIPVHRD